MLLTPIPEISGLSCGTGNCSLLYVLLFRCSHGYTQSTSSESAKNSVGRGGRPSTACDILYNLGFSVQRIRNHIFWRKAMASISLGCDWQGWPINIDNIVCKGGAGFDWMRLACVILYRKIWAYRNFPSVDQWSNSSIEHVVVWL